MALQFSDTQSSLNLSGREFLLKQCLQTSEASELLGMLAGIELSSAEIRHALKVHGTLEVTTEQGAFVLKLAHKVKQHGRYRCDFFARPLGFLA